MSWFTKYKENVAELKGYADDLEERETFLLQALTDLSRGLGIKVDGCDWDVAMRRLAAERLQTVAKMRVRSRPYVWT